MEACGVDYGQYSAIWTGARLKSARACHLQLSQRGVPCCEGASFFPSPLVGEGGFAKRRRVRGLSPRIETPHPSRTSSAPPSPTRGEGRKQKPPLPTKHS